MQEVQGCGKREPEKYGEVEWENDVFVSLFMIIFSTMH